MACMKMARRNFTAILVALAVPVALITPAASAVETENTIVLTSYSAFSRDHNSSGDVAKRVEKILDKEGFNVVSQEIETSWDTFTSELDSLVEENNPDTIISLGESSLAPAPLVELIGYNKRYGQDANGTPGRGPVTENGPLERKAPEENKSAQQKAMSSGHRIFPSYDAGRYLCNAALYTNLGFLEEGRVNHAGFVHVPALNQDDPKTEQEAEAISDFIKNLTGK